MERVSGIEPPLSAWKAEVLPLNYTRDLETANQPPDRLFDNRSTCFPVPSAKSYLVEGVGFEPTKAKPTDLQSAPVDRLGTPPLGHAKSAIVACF